ncbi:MAG: hypothetical protein ABIA67_00885 [Candidatus Margulisiibacteriota bacterium]
MKAKKGERYRMKLRILMMVFILLFLTSASVVAAPSIDLLTPEKLDAIAYPGEKVVLSWSKVAGVIGYNVYRKKGDDQPFKKIASLMRSNSLEDRDVIQGKSYEYYVTSTGMLDAESKRSNLASAPHMFIDPHAEVSRIGRESLNVRNVRTGEIVSAVVPGDIITYIIKVGNNGYGKATSVLITFPVPVGTKLMPNSMSAGKFNAKYSYFDERQGKWLSEVNNAENISKVRFQILDQIDPLVNGYNGQLSFKVIIET